MLLKEFEFIGEITDEQIEEFMQTVKGEDIIYLTTECILPRLNPLEGIHELKEILRIFADEKNIEDVKTVLVMVVPSEFNERIIRIKLYSEVPVIDKILL